MRTLPPFVQAFGSVEKLQVKELIFSRGTYQFEIKEGRKTFAPFLQFKEDELSDFFCTCKISEKGGGCPHLAAAYLAIFEGTEEPLHLRFAKSLWNILCRQAAEKVGYEPEVLKSKEGKYIASSKFWIEPLDKETRKTLQSILQKTKVETEQTSLKFSNLSSEEMAQYKAGKASELLRYELSFWSEIARWLMALSKEPYQMEFMIERLPVGLKVEFNSVRVWFFLDEGNLSSIIPALANVSSPLKPLDSEEETIQGIDYDPEEKKIWVRKRSVLPQKRNGEEVGDWLFVREEGFYKKELSLGFKDEIFASEIGKTLIQYSKIFSRYLPMDLKPSPARYHLFFDEAASLHVQLYVEKLGDMQQKGSAIFAPFVYLPGKGFVLLEGLFKETAELVIQKENISAFINEHRVWFQEFKGFQTHLGTLDAHLTYSLSKQDVLSFSSELALLPASDETVDLGEWVYIKGSGFYMKKEASVRLPIHSGLVLSKEEIGPFIAKHREDLEQVEHFFTLEPFVMKAGLSLGLTSEGFLCIFPKIEHASGIDPTKVRMFGDFLYLEGKGFCEMPPPRLPEKYRSRLVISPSQETSFFAYEFEPLRPYLLEVDPKLQRSQHLRLKVKKIEPSKKKRGREWWIDFLYVSEIGSVDLFSLWDAFYLRKQHLFSSAGLLSLKEARFQWLRQLQRKRLDRKKGMVRITTLEWIRLNVFETIDQTGISKETAKFLEEMNSFEIHRLFNLSELKSSLRPYQETGFQWLWFLYCHGLSGLLCDDMGLGKTHQAMALLAAVTHEDKERKNKYLVVCPTSVIYHWQELLRRFLPHIRVLTYYGLARSLEAFESGYDLVLTSYGILRSGPDELQKISFEVAIFDEIQMAKNASSQTHLALRKTKARMRLGLTGTPIENRLRELKALFDAVLPGYMPTDAVFRDLFVHPIEKFQDEAKKQLLSKLIKPFILRRKKSEVLLDLPEKIEEIAYCDLAPEQKGLYKEVLGTIKNTLYADLQDLSKPVSYVHIFSALSQLKQICDHPSLFLGDVSNAFQHESGKWDLFLELLHEALGSDQKVVIFSQYLGMLQIIEQYLQEKEIEFATIKGSTRDRSEPLVNFRENPQCKVFTASLLAAGIGIDLTVASVVIHYDRWWNPAKENQATDRVHRIGQNRGVQVFKLVTKNTIEEYIHELIEKKKWLLEEVVGKDDVDKVNYLSREELIKIFEKIFVSSE